MKGVWEGVYTVARELVRCAADRAVQYEPVTLKDMNIIVIITITM